MNAKTNGVVCCAFLIVGNFSPVSNAQTLFIPASERVRPVLGGPEISIAAVGDLMLGSWVTPVLEQNGATYPYQKTTPYLESADLAIANLEAPFTLEGELFEKKFNFKVPPKFASGLPQGGIDVVTLANNHTMDYGETGLISTFETLDRVSIHYSGAGQNKQQAHQPVVVEAQGRRIAFFGYSMTFPTEFYAGDDSAGTAYPEPDLMAANISMWDDSVDFVVASFHWGAEKRETPKDYQITFAHLAIDSGADLVLGHHPHVLQGLEVYKNRLIAYSLGNYVFGSYSKHSVDSIILKVILRDDGLFYARCVAINVDNRQVEFQPEVVSGARQQVILSKLRELSAPLNQGTVIIDDSGLIWGDWVQFYEAWLLHTSVNSFWNVLLPDEIWPVRGLGQQTVSKSVPSSAN